MIIIHHDHNKLISVIDIDNNEDIILEAKTAVAALKELAALMDDRIIVWANSDMLPNLNLKYIRETFNVKNKMLSFSVDKSFDSSLHYIERTPFIKINRHVIYPTWLMSGLVGAINSNYLKRFTTYFDVKRSLDFNLKSVAKIGMPQGLFCYSDPNLLKISLAVNYPESNKKDFKEIFLFVKLHYKLRWIFFLLCCLIIYERQFPLYALLVSLRKRRYIIDKSLLNVDVFQVLDENQKQYLDGTTIDVIIPTLGRKQYVLDVLGDLRRQSKLPSKVILVEQNPDSDSKSELADFILSKKWPFKIKHHFINQTGACNARNLALSEVESDWVFFNDDDNRFSPTLIEEFLSGILSHGFEAGQVSYLREDQDQIYDKICQCAIFGSGNSIVNRRKIGNLKFDLSLEHGYGEDSDFGYQLRNKGIDILYLPKPAIIHLMASSGGFRSKFVYPWSQNRIQPKPSPTIMYFMLKNFSQKQLLGYKMFLFIRELQSSSFTQVFRMLRNFNRRWIESKNWAKKLSEEGVV